MTFLKESYSILKKHQKRIVICIIVLLLLLYQLIWLLIITVSIFLLRFLLLYLIKYINSKLLSKIAKGFTFFIIIFAISISMKLFVFGIFRIPSGSMENTLYTEDIILVNKLTYGPKLPRTPFDIPWINFLFYLNKDARANIDKDWWEYQRFSGIRDMAQDDVLVFQTSRTYFMVKRCVGLPGDNLKIEDGEIFTNNKKDISASTVKEHYNLVVINKKKFYNQLDSLKIEATIYPRSKFNNELTGTFSGDDYERIKQFQSIESIKKKIENDTLSKNLFLVDNTKKWNVDRMGTFTIPKKGLVIELNENTFNIYKKTLQEFEKVALEKREESYFLDGAKAVNYTFKKDYIFVLGDNRKNSKDSRYIGFIPLESVVGKVQCVLYSNYNDSFNWSRLFKSVN
jgi:signal peptidase I